MVGQGSQTTPPTAVHTALGLAFKPLCSLLADPSPLVCSRTPPFRKGAKGLWGTLGLGGLCLRTIHRPGTSFSRTEPPLLALPALRRSRLARVEGWPWGTGPPCSQVARFLNEARLPSHPRLCL